MGTHIHGRADELMPIGVSDAPESLIATSCVGAGELQNSTYTRRGTRRSRKPLSQRGDYAAQTDK